MSGGSAWPCGLADGRSESAGETVLRLFHRSRWRSRSTPQVELFDADGDFVARADLLVNGTKYVHEYDGAVHTSDKEQHRTDLRRERGWAGIGVRPRGYTARRPR